MLNNSGTYPILTILDLTNFERLNLEEELDNPVHPPDYNSMTFVRLEDKEVLSLDNPLEWNGTYSIEYIEDYKVEVKHALI